MPKVVFLMLCMPHYIFLKTLVDLYLEHKLFNESWRMLWRDGKRYIWPVRALAKKFHNIWYMKSDPKEKNEVTLIQINLDIIPSITILQVIWWFFQNISKREKNICNSTFRDIILVQNIKKSYSIRLIHADTNPRKDDVLNVIFFSDKTLRGSTTTTMLEKFFSGKQKNTSSNCKWWIATQKINLSRLIITWKHVNFQIS